MALILGRHFHKSELTSQEFNFTNCDFSLLSMFFLYFTNIVKFEFVKVLMDTWREFKSVEKDEELLKMVDKYRTKYLVQGVKIYVNVYPIIILSVLILFVLKMDLSEKSNMTFFAGRLATMSAIALLDSLSRKYRLVLNNLLPIFLLTLGISLIKENLSYKEPRMYDLWVPYQMMYFLVSIIH